MACMPNAYVNCNILLVNLFALDISILTFAGYCYRVLMYTAKTCILINALLRSSNHCSSCQLLIHETHNLGNYIMSIVFKKGAYMQPYTLYVYHVN